MRWISLQEAGLRLRNTFRLPSLVTIAVLVLAASPTGQAKRYPLDSATGLRLHNVVAEPAVLQGKKGVRIRHSEEALRRLDEIRTMEEQARFPQLAAIEGLDFTNGVIEAEIAGTAATRRRGSWLRRYRLPTVERRHGVRRVLPSAHERPRGRSRATQSCRSVHLTPGLALVLPPEGKPGKV
jgi:hypothetical protein